MGKVKNSRIPKQPSTPNKPSEFDVTLNDLLKEYDFRIKDVTKSLVNILKVCLNERKALIAKIEEIERSKDGKQSS